MEESLPDSSKEKPIELDEESSDGENSVIILDSDTEPDDDGADENREDDEQDDDEEYEDSESDEDEDSDSSVDSDSVNSVWSDVKESAGIITAEAAEAEIIRKFEKAMTFIADNQNDRGQKLLRNLLDDPIIACYRQDDVDYEYLEEPPRYAKMLKIYIAIHKNLAKLCEKELEDEKIGERILGDKEIHEQKNMEIQHLCQVLAYDPNNTEIWLDVAMKCVEFGDLNFALYSFKRCETLKESLEAHASLLYVTSDYSSCLTVLKQFQEQHDEGLNDKAKYLKYKIRSTNQYYKRLCDRIFEEDEVYADIDVVEKRKIIAFDERIEELQKKLEERKKDIEKYATEDDTEEKSSALQVKVYAELDLRTVCALFCDLFDRIQTYSHPREQLIEITEWESRQDHLDVVNTVEQIVDIVSCVEDLTQKTVEEILTKKRKGKRQKQQEKKEYLANWRKRLFVERSNSEDIGESEANTTADEDDSQADDEDGESKVPENELAQEFHFVCSNIIPIRCDDKVNKKTSQPFESCDFVDCDRVLNLLGSALVGETKTILEILEFTLDLLTNLSPSSGALPEEIREVTREMYNRLAFCEDIQELKYLRISVLVFELDCQKATQALVLRYISPFWKERDENGLGNKAFTEDEKRSFVLRFIWKYVHTGLNENTKLEYLHTLRSLLDSTEFVATACGSFSALSIDLAIDELEKKKRIDSIKHLWMSKNYETLLEILRNDIDFSVIGMDEAIDLLSYWLQSLEKLEAHKDLLELSARAMQFYLFSVEEKKIQRNLEIVLQKLHRIPGTDFSAMRNLAILSTIGYFICHAMKKYPKFEKDWRNWKILYEIVRIQRGDSREYIEQLNRNEDPDVMPLLELDLLVKAHEILGRHNCCAQKNYEFLLFTVDCYRELVEENISLLEICYLKENGYLWNNLNEELAQILFCLYGKFSRKVRARENHENGGKCGTTLDIATRVLSVILVQPLPLHDDKEKLMHDVVELINSKYSYLLEISDEKIEALKEFEKALQQSNNIKEVNLNLERCRDDVHSYLRSMVWYAMGLQCYRTNSFKDAAKYSMLYLLTEESMCDNRLRLSAWAILALTNIHDLFQLELFEIHEQWKWRIMPSRLAIQAQEHEPLPHFELAARLYQLASCLARFYRTLPKSDARRQDINEVAKLRQESRKHFDISIDLTRINDNGTQPEHQWLCYYFIGKLEAKSAKWDILKVVESFYEAACGCELTGFYYPQKVQTKKQQNFEPLEVHYQAFSCVYKYLVNNETPDLKILRKLKVILSVLSDGHKVVKQSSSLFKVNPDVYELVDDLVMRTVMEEHGIEEDDESEFISSLRDELCIDLKEMSIRAFTLLTEKFPHLKSHFRLAQLYYERGEIDMASDQIFKNAFKRKKRDDGMFDNCVEIACTDLNRNGSYSFHIERCIKLGAQIAQKTNDLHNVVAMLQTMIGIIVKGDEQHVDRTSWRPVVVMYLSAMEHIVHSRDHTSTRSTPSPGPDHSSKIMKPHHLSMKSLRTELWRIWQALNKSSTPQKELLSLIREKVETLISHSFRSVEELRRLMQISANTNINAGNGGKKKNAVMKRKLDAVNVAKSLTTSSTLDGFIQTQSSPSRDAVTSKNFLQMAGSILMDVQISPSKQSSNDFALQLVRLATAQASSTNNTHATLPTSTTGPSDDSATPQPPNSIVSKFVSSPLTTAKSSNSSVPSNPIATSYSPISSDDEIQCIEPPTKKPANNSQQLKLGQSISRKPPNPVVLVTKPVALKPPASSNAIPLSELTKSIPETSSPSIPPASTSASGPSVAPIHPTVPSRSSSLTKTPVHPDLSKFQGLIPNGIKTMEDFTKYFMAHVLAGSADESKKQAALIAMQKLSQSEHSQNARTLSNVQKLTPPAANSTSLSKSVPPSNAKQSSNVTNTNNTHAQMLRALQHAQLAQQEQRALQEQKNSQQVKLAMEKAMKQAAESEAARKEKEQERDYFQQIAYNAAAQSSIEKERQAQMKAKQVQKQRELMAKQAKEKHLKERQATIVKHKDNEYLKQQAALSLTSSSLPSQLMNYMLHAANQLNLPSTSGGAQFLQQSARQLQTSSVHKSSLTTTASTLREIRTSPQSSIVRPQPNRATILPKSTTSQSSNDALGSNPLSAQLNRTSAYQHPPNTSGGILPSLEAALQNFDEATRNAIRQQFLDGNKKSKQ